MTTLFRFALLMIAVVLSAPLRLASIADGEHVSNDDRLLSPSGIIDEDDSMSEGSAGEDLPDLTWRLEGLVPRDSGPSEPAVELSFAAAGLAASSGVPGDLFRPPRA